MALIIAGVFIFACGYALSNMAYNEGGATNVYFYPGRYYGGIAFMIFEVVGAIVGAVSFVIGGTASLEKTFSKEKHRQKQKESCEYFVNGQCDITNFRESRGKMSCESNQKDICCYDCTYQARCPSKCTMRL